MNKEKLPVILKKENDIYIYFETIEQLEPQKILDIGVFLKRVGSVSRKVMNRRIPEGVRLDGVDFFPETDFPVWRQVYDKITDSGHFLEERVAARYDLAVALGMEALELQPFFGQIIEKVSEYSRYLLVDRLLNLWEEQTEIKVIDLQVEEDGYYLLDFGE